MELEMLKRGGARIKLSRVEVRFINVGNQNIALVEKSQIDK